MTTGCGGGGGRFGSRCEGTWFTLYNDASLGRVVLTISKGKSVKHKMEIMAWLMPPFCN